MLKALYDYAVSNHLALPPGFVKKTIKAYISLSSAGEFLGIELTEGEIVTCPDIGSLANGTDKSNVLAEKRSVILADNVNAKGIFFRSELEAGAEAEPMFRVCLNALIDEGSFNSIILECDKLKIKPADRISFRVGGRSILESTQAAGWWAVERAKFIKTDSDVRVPCLITGKLTSPSATVPPISGLSFVGGHARGDAFICFDKPSFCSYGFKQGANAPVSEEAFAAVKAALDDLMSDTSRAPILAGMRCIHWYDKPIPQEEDCLESVFSGLMDDDDDGDGNDTTRNDLEEKEQAAAAEYQATQIIESIKSGKHAPALPNEYFILMLTGVNGRVMIRRYERGSYEDLQKNIRLWQKDISLLNRRGTGIVKPKKLVAMLINLLSKQKDNKDVFKRLAKELSGVTPAVITSIISGSQLPDTVAARSLAFIRSKMLDSDNDQNGPQIPDATACQWLKAWLMRRERKKNKEEVLMTKFNPNHPNTAYHCGALMAIYAAIQQEAMPDVNVGIMQRYYASASQMPALVIGQLQKLSVYHMAKLDNPHAIRRYEKLLNEECSALGEVIPVTLDLEQQSYFALGYRQFYAKLDSDKLAARAAKEQK